jgi:hypothetical protein
VYYADVACVRVAAKSLTGKCLSLREGESHKFFRRLFIEVDQIPVLGTAQLDLKGLSELVKERFACSVP